MNTNYLFIFVIYLLGTSVSSDDKSSDIFSAFNVTKNETRIKDKDDKKSEDENFKTLKINQSSSDNSSYEYGSSKNPAKSCKDLALKGLIKNQPNIFFIETTDHEILQVFCPQTETFDFSKINGNFTNQTQIYTNLVSMVKNSNPKNTLVMINGTGSSSDELTDSTHGGLNLIINQKTSFNTDTPESHEAKARFIDEDYQNIHNITSKVENQTEINVNSTNNNNQTSDDGVYYAKKIKETEPLTDNLIGKNTISSNSRRNRIYQVKSHETRTKKIGSKEKMKIPLYKPMNNLLKGISSSKNKKKNDKQTTNSDDEKPRKLTKNKSKKKQ